MPSGLWYGGGRTGGGKCLNHLPTYEKMSDREVVRNTKGFRVCAFCGSKNVRLLDCRAFVGDLIAHFETAPSAARRYVFVPEEV